MRARTAPKTTKQHLPLPSMCLLRTVLSRTSQVVMIGDGQVSVGPVAIKPNVRKVRRIGDGVVAGFAGAWVRGLAACGSSVRPGARVRRCVDMWVGSAWDGFPRLHKEREGVVVGCAGAWV